MESISDSQPINVDATTSTTTTTAISTTLAVKTARTETNESNSDTPAKRIRREESVKGDAVVPVSIVKPVDTAAAYVWFRKLGSPRYVVAPMVNASELPYRLLTRKYGAQLCYTPMLHAACFVQSETYRKEQFQTCPEDRPLIAQFCANDPQILLKAAMHVAPHVDAVDINFGCPQGIAKRGHYGSFLLEEWDLVRALISTLHQHLPVPVTCKIRILPKREDTLALCKLIQESGCSLLTVHGRVRTALKDKVGANDFEIIKEIKQLLDIPVFSNGGIESFEDVERCLQDIGVDGVMSSEAILENPLLFAPTHKWNGVRVAEEYLELYNQSPVSSSIIRGHMFKFLYRQLSVHTHLRAQLGNCPVSEIGKIVAELRCLDESMDPEEHKAKYLPIPTWYARHLKRAMKAQAESAEAVVLVSETPQIQASAPAAVAM